MKNYWLVTGGMVIGFGISSFKKDEDNTTSIIQTLVGVGLVLGGIYGFKK